MRPTKCLIVQPIHAIGLDYLRQAVIEPVLAPDASEETILGLIGDVEAVITRNANALDFEIPSAAEFDRAAGMLLRRGYS